MLCPAQMLGTAAAIVAEFDFAFVAAAFFTRPFCSCTRRCLAVAVALSLPLLAVALVGAQHAVPGADAWHSRSHCRGVRLCLRSGRLLHAAVLQLYSSLPCCCGCLVVAVTCRRLGRGTACCARRRCLAQPQPLSRSSTLPS